MKVKKLGWLGRLLGANFRMRTQYRIKSGFSVVACDNEAWPVAITTGGGEFHVLRVSRETTISMVDFISRTFGSGNEEFERDPEIGDHSNPYEIEFGDRIVAWHTKRGWSLAKRGVGMPSAELSDDEWRLTGSALEKALHESLNSKVVLRGETK